MFFCHSNSCLNIFRIFSRSTHFFSSCHFITSLLATHI
nr:MAG TPA_asm: hypothetical protein [Caudoviricetes sp.]